jgi:hypothetical protein
MHSEHFAMPTSISVPSIGAAAGPYPAIVNKDLGSDLWRQKLNHH